MSEAKESGFYRIGAVARMTGIALPTLRMWERRYAVVEPERTPAGGRLYTREHVARLALLQAAVQSGHAIGTVARLPDAEIQARLKETMPALARDQKAVRLAVVGPTLPTLMAGPEMADPAIEVIATHESVSAANEAEPLADLGVLVVELPTLHPDEVEGLISLITESRARLTVAVYGFTSRRILRRLDLLNVLCIRAPADLTQLMRICRLVSPRLPVPAAAPAEEVPRLPERRYSDRQLLRLASLHTAIRCECPQHLAGIISSLSVFERYSRECASATPADAAVHALLHEAAAQARHQMELALGELLEAEGLEL